MDKYTKENEVKLKEIEFEDDFVEEIEVCERPFNPIFKEDFYDECECEDKYDCDCDCDCDCDECIDEQFEDYYDDCLPSTNKKKAVIIGASVATIVAGGIVLLKKANKKK